VVYSLWQIDDKQSTWIIKKFYDHIDADMAYADALRRAKLDYLKNHSGDLAAPYYWGGVVITGEDGKIQKKSTMLDSYGWLVGLTIGALGLIAFYALHRKKRVRIEDL